MTNTEAILALLVVSFYGLGALATMMGLGPQGYFDEHAGRRLLEVICIWWFIIMSSAWHGIFDKERQ